MLPRIKPGIFPAPQPKGPVRIQGCSNPPEQTGRSRCGLYDLFLVTFPSGKIVALLRRTDQSACPSDSLSNYREVHGVGGTQFIAKPSSGGVVDLEKSAVGFPRLVEYDLAQRESIFSAENGF